MTIEELQAVGLERMDEPECRDFLASQHAGVLGLPTDGAPYLIPLSYGFDGDSTLYFTYVLGAESRKEALTEHAETARFLVYSAESAYMWESVMLSGSIDLVPEEEWEDLEDILSEAWHPALFAEAELSRGVDVYAFNIEEQSGIKHTGLPPGFDPV